MGVQFVTLVTGRWRQEDQKFKVFSDYVTEG